MRKNIAQKLKSGGEGVKNKVWKIVDRIGKQKVIPEKKEIL